MYVANIFQAREPQFRPATMRIYRTPQSASGVTVPVVPGGAAVEDLSCERFERPMRSLVNGHSFDELLPSDALLSTRSMVQGLRDLLNAPERVLQDLSTPEREHKPS